MLTEQQRKSIPLTYKLTPAEANVFALLLEVPMATNQMVEDKVVGGATPAKIIIYRLRDQLYGTPITIHRRNRVGYWIDDATKERIFEALNNNIKFLPVQARDGIEAQRGLNDVFPSDNYSATGRGVL